MPTDSERIDWLEKSKKLSLFTDGSTWTTESGQSFVSRFSLSRNDTQHRPAKTLRDQIDQAMMQK